MRASCQEPGRGYAGVGKKLKRGTKLTSKQRRRREKGTVMAERVASRFERKVQESVGRSKAAVGRKVRNEKGFELCPVELTGM